MGIANVCWIVATKQKEICKLMINIFAWTYDWKQMLLTAAKSFI
jgi:hypothetical protein